MTRTAVVLASVVAAGCGSDYGLEVVVERPAEPARSLAVATTIAVYESPTLGCDAIAHAEVSDDELATAEVAVLRLDGAGQTGDLRGLSRRDRKLVVARMYADTGALVAAGCAEVGELTGATTVRVPTAVAASVAVAAIDVTDPYGVRVTVLDPVGDSLAGREVGWRVFGPAGSAPALATGVSVRAGAPVWDASAPACTDADGTVDVHPVPPATVGGYVTRLRVAWPAAPPVPLSGFVVPGVAGAPLAAVGAPRSQGPRCALRVVAAGRRLVCLTDAGARQYELSGVGTGAQPMLAPVGAVQGPAGLVGVAAVARGSEQEVYGLDASGGWVELFGGGALPAVGCAGCQVVDFAIAPGCEAGAPGALVLHARGAVDRVWTVAFPDGGAARELEIPRAPAVGVALRGAGCVTEIDSAGARRELTAIALDLGAGDRLASRLYLPCAGAAGSCSIGLPAAGAAVGFVREAGEQQLLAAALAADGTDVAGWVVRASGGSQHLVERRRLASAGPPSHLASGRLDADGGDLLWALRGEVASGLQVSYAQPVDGGARLSALTRAGFAIEQLQLLDLDGDGLDDLVGVGVGPLGTTFVFAIPFGVPGPVQPLVAPAACEGA